MQMLAVILKLTHFIPHHFLIVIIQYHMDKLVNIKGVIEPEIHTN